MKDNPICTKCGNPIPKIDLVLNPRRTVCLDCLGVTKRPDPEGDEIAAPATLREDVVNHPSHYAPNGRDSFMHMKDQMGKDAFDGFLQGNAIKYVQRYAFKGKPTEDLCKAAFYLFHLAFEAAGGGKESLEGMGRRLAETLAHAAEHYGLEAS